jgi:thioredoxin-dependent peroxiredoxin
MPIFSWLFSEPLGVGERAPDFTLTDQESKSATLSSFRGVKNVVLIFYPGDDTSVCTKQLCEFRDNWNLVNEKDTVVFGINPQSAKSHQKFAVKWQYPFPLLVDEKRRVANLYNASGLIVKRTVYLIGKSGTIRFARRGKPMPEEVLAAAES